MFVAFLKDLAEQPGRAFAHVVVIALIATAAVLLLHFLVSLIARSRSPNRHTLARWNLGEKLVYAVTIASVAALGATAFYAVIAQGVLEGWLLLAHMAGAGVFVVVLPLVALTWATPNRFGRRRQVPFPDSRDADSQTCQAAEIGPLPFLPLTKLTFWLILATSALTAGSMLLGMVPLVATDGLRQLLDLHRYSGLVLVVAAIVHCYTVCLGRLGLG